MRYELMKSFGNKTLIMMLVILMFVNGLEMFYHSKYYKHTFSVDENYTTEDYHELISKAVSDIQNGEDIFLSKLLIETFKNREITNDAYDSKEAEFVDYSKNGIYVMILIVLMVYFTIDTERKSGMNRIISITSGKNTRIILMKQLSLAVCCFILNVVFLVEGIVEYKIIGGLNLGMKLYNVPGYFGTWFTGNILTYKIICTMGMSLVHIIIGNIIYIFAGLFEKIFAVISVSVIMVLMYICNKISPVNCFMNIFSFYDSGCLVRDFIVIDMGNIVTYRLWAALVIVLVCAIAVNICNFLIYRKRRYV